MSMRALLRRCGVPLFAVLTPALLSCELLSCGQVVGRVGIEQTEVPDAPAGAGFAPPALGATEGEPPVADPALAAPPSEPAPIDSAPMPSFPPSSAAAADSSGSRSIAVASCLLGAFQCVGATLQYCETGAAWRDWQSCGSPALCQSIPAGRCLPVACQVAERRCDGARLEQCNADATGWTLLDTCSSAASCNPAQSTCTASPAPADAGAAPNPPADARNASDAAAAEESGSDGANSNGNNATGRSRDSSAGEDGNGGGRTAGDDGSSADDANGRDDGAGSRGDDGSDDGNGNGRRNRDRNRSDD